jgi:hypothetical protein
MWLYLLKKSECFIILEGDAMQVVNEINFENQPLNRFEHFIEGRYTIGVMFFAVLSCYLCAERGKFTSSLSISSGCNSCPRLNMVGENSTHYL